MDLVRVKRLEDPERMSLFVALSLVNLDAQQGRSLVKGLVDTVVSLALASRRGFARPQQADGPAVLASGQIEAPGTLLTREDVDVVGRDTVLLERPHRCVDLVLAVEQPGHPVDEREQMAARVGIGIDSGHSLPLNSHCSGSFTRDFHLGARISGPYIY